MDGRWKGKTDGFKHLPQEVIHPKHLWHRNNSIQLVKSRKETKDQATQGQVIYNCLNSKALPKTRWLFNSSGRFSIWRKSYLKTLSINAVKRSTVAQTVRVSQDKLARKVIEVAADTDRKKTRQRTKLFTKDLWLLRSRDIQIRKSKQGWKARIMSEIHQVKIDLNDNEAANLVAITNRNNCQVFLNSSSS